MDSNLVSLILVTGLVTACAKNGNFQAESGTGTNLSTVDQDAGSSIPVPDPSAETATFSPNYKPMALSWESAIQPDRVAWSDALYNLVGKYFENLNKAKDIATFCPRYSLLTRDQRINAWAAVIAATTYFESGYNPLSNSIDVGTAGNKDTYSVGLLQLSVVDQANYGFKFAYNFADLQDPFKNLTLGMAIMNKQIAKYGKILIEVGASGLYWAVLHPGGKYDQSARIAAMVKSRISFCQ